MSKKRRVFDIDLPEEEATETFPAEKVSKGDNRGPMATAIVENADSLRERQSLEAQIREENDALAHEHVRLKNLGLITELVPLEEIETYKLIRDRTKALDFELGELVESIKEIGLSNPIRVEPRADGRYELVQGYRRLCAFKELLKETGDEESYGRIPAGIMPAGETLETLYRRMVDENLVRKDISFFEMAQLALHYAADPGTKTHDSEKAVAILFKSSSYSKRSYVRTFIKVVEYLGEVVKYGHEIPRALGLQLATVLVEVPGTAKAIDDELKDWGDNRSIKDELSVLRRFSGALDEMEEGYEQPAKPIKKAGPVAGKAKMTFQIKRPQGAAKCVAGAGRLEIKLDKDFSTLDRRRLEAAVASLLDQID